jgi:predicted PurR-regulated permease PerM
MAPLLRVAHQINQSVSGYVLGDLLTSLIAGVVVFIALVSVGVPFPLLWALWVALVDFLPMIGGALVGGVPAGQGRPRLQRAGIGAQDRHAADPARSTG